MKLLRIMLIVLMLFSITALSLSCAGGEDSTSGSEQQIVTVQRGDLTIDITAVGNLALSQKEKLAFEIPGTVAEVLVEEGDTVEEGQVLAKLDTSEWEEQLSALEDQITASERQLTAKQLDLLQAEINLINAEVALEKTDTTYSVSDFEVAQAEVDEAERNLEETLDKLYRYPVGGPGYEVYQGILLQAQARLDSAEAMLDAMLSGFDTEDVVIKKLQVEIARGRLEDARKAVEDAQKAIEDAQKELNEVKYKSPEITAPIAGFITKVNVEGGDEVMKGTVAVELADPTKFEADILVNEMDIFQVKVGGEATVQVDAMQMIVLPAEVTRIAPTAIVQAGVVNYEVKVDIRSLEAIVQERQETMQKAMQDIASGELPEPLKRAVEAGRITKEQAKEMMEQMKAGEMPSPPEGEGEMPFPPGGGEGEMPFPPGIGEGEMPFSTESRQIPTMLSEDFQLREGLTVTVSIIVDERNDVLLVPNGAIIREGLVTYVQVIENGVIEQRKIQTGLSDWQYTEVTEGLNEGDQVIIPQSSTTTTTPQQGGGMPFFGPARK